jgi:hypothetical protein
MWRLKRTIFVSPTPEDSLKYCNPERLREIKAAGINITYEEILATRKKLRSFRFMVVKALILPMSHFRILPLINTILSFEIRLVGGVHHTPSLHSQRLVPKVIWLCSKNATGSITGRRLPFH